MKPMALIGLIIASAALFPGCIFYEAIQSGCETEGTVGAEGKVLFCFMQSEEDLSSSSGNAFATGTTASLGIESAADDEALPSWSLQSSDEEIFTVDEAMQEEDNEDYPLILSMYKQGEAKVEVVSQEDGSIIDYVALKLLTPDGLLARVSHPVLGSEKVDDKIALASGSAGCVLDFLLFKKDGTSEKYLFGEFEVTSDVEIPGLSLVHDPITADHAYYSITVAAGAPGSYDLVFQGPADSETALTLLAASPGQVDSLDFVFTPTSGDGKHAGDWGYLTAVQYTSGVPLCSGHAVVFMTSDPYILFLDNQGVPSDAEDTVAFALQTSGVVRVTATLVENPGVGKSIDLVVQPRVTY